MAASLCQQYERDGTVVPRSIKKNTFLVAAIDNIDWNPSGNLSMDSFHGTSITFHQQPTDSSVDQPEFTLSNQGYKIELPDSYAIVESIDQLNAKIPAPTKVVTYPFFNFEEELKKEELWAKQSRVILAQPSVAETDQISWAGYFSQNATSSLVKPAEMGILPLFEEKAASIPMLKHGLKIIFSAIDKLNTNQIPVVACDQPIYALMKHSMAV